MLPAHISLYDSGQVREIELGPQGPYLSSNLGKN